MSTPNPAASTVTVFPVLKSEFSWTPSTTAAGGQALPPGETQSGSTIGIRLDGDTTHSAGNYQYLIPISGTAMSETLAQLAAFLTKALPAGNYWGALDQTDILSGSPATSAWTAEVPFSIPAILATPAPPAAFQAS
jgi:hypothetical protein